MKTKKDVKIIESVWDIIMKNTEYENIDFTKFKNAHVDYEKKQINLGNYILKIEQASEQKG